MCNIKFTILALLNVQVSGIEYIYSVVQPQPLSISKTVLSSQAEILSPWNT